MTARTQPTQKRVRQLLHYNVADRVEEGPIGNDQFRAILAAAVGEFERRGSRNGVVAAPSAAAAGQ